MQMWHTESGSHASFAFLISDGFGVWEHLVCGGQPERLCESSPVRAHTQWPAPAPSPPPRHFHVSLSCCWGDGGFFVRSPRSPDCFCFSCWCRRQRHTECKQVPKLFTLSRKRWPNFPFPPTTLFFFLEWCLVLCYTSFASFVHFSSLSLLLIFMYIGFFSFHCRWFADNRAVEYLWKMKWNKAFIVAILYSDFYTLNLRTFLVCSF